jgi:Pentapeptide repeats (8 copies)
MANPEHLEILKRGVKKWNQWREENPKIKPDLTGANLRGRRLKSVDFKDANLSRAILTECDLSGANLTKAKLVKTTLRDGILAGAILYSAILRQSDCRDAFLRWADLSRADFTDANLSNADLRRTHLARSVFTRADISGCAVYGSAIWNVELEGAVQTDLVITEHDELQITVDDLEVAQFVYLILNNKNIRNAINSLTSKAVLILGRFTVPKRKAVLDGLREKLREFNLLPIVFDFHRPADRDYTETIQTLAGMSMFVIVDVTSPKSTPLELEATVKQFKIPYIPIIDVSVDRRPFSMLDDLQKSFHWVLKTLKYKSKDQLLNNIKVAIIDRAMAKRRKLIAAKARKMDTLSDLLNE